MTEAKRVVVAGGGISGLTAAFYLHKKAQELGMDLSVELVEKETRLGGKVSTTLRDGFILEEGPDSFLARKKSATVLCEHLGIADRLVGTNPQARKNYILRNGQLYLMPPGTMMGVPTQITPFARTPLISPFGKLRAAMDLFLPRSKEDADVSLGLFLRRRLGNELVDNLIEPLLSGIYAGDVNQLSMRATFPMFQEMEKKYRSLILGITQQRKATMPQRREGSMFLALNTGLSSLVDTLTERLKRDGVTVRLGNGIKRVDKHGSPDAPTFKPYRVELETGEIIEADAVVLCTPAFVAEKILSPWINAEPLTHIPYTSVATVGMAFSRDQVNHPMDGSGFVVPRKEGRFITATTWATSKWPHTTPHGKALLRCFVGRSGDTRHREMSDEEIIKQSLADLRDMMGLTAEPEWSMVFRWDHAMPQYLVNHLQRLRELEMSISRELPGVVLAGSGYYGLGMPDCMDQGEDAAGKTINFLHKLD